MFPPALKEPHLEQELVFPSIHNVEEAAITYPFTAVHDCLFHKFGATLNTWRPSSPSTTKRHDMSL
jgi:hypothetical protein